MIREVDIQGDGRGGGGLCDDEIGSMKRSSLWGAFFFEGRPAIGREVGWELTNF